MVRADVVFDAAETVLKSVIVLVENVWTLAGRKYRLAKTELVAILERLFSESKIRFEDDQVVGAPCKRTEASRRRARPGWRRAPVSLTCPRRLVQFECWCIDGFSAKLGDRGGRWLFAALTRSEPVRQLCLICRIFRVGFQGYVQGLDHHDRSAMS